MISTWVLWSQKLLKYVWACISVDPGRGLAGIWQLTPKMLHQSGCVDGYHNVITPNTLGLFDMASQKWSQPIIKPNKSRMASLLFPVFLCGGRKQSGHAWLNPNADPLLLQFWLRLQCLRMYKQTRGGTPIYLALWSSSLVKVLTC